MRHGTSLGRKLTELDRGLRLRVREACEAALQTALERAEARAVNRLRTSSDMRAILRAVPRGRVVSTVGEAKLAQYGVALDELTADAFDNLAVRVSDLAFDVWEAAASRLNVKIDPITARDLCDDAAAVLRTRLTALAHERLKNPRTAADTQGETSPRDAVPGSYAREFVARAGGGSPSGNLVAGAKLAAIGNWMRVGIATGKSFLGLAENQERIAYSPGITGDRTAPEAAPADRFIWDYGNIPRDEFPPHEGLDGIECFGDDDPILANVEAWPPFEFYFAGDHDGCECDAVPAVEEA